jgi:hypothetical protein
MASSSSSSSLSTTAASASTPSSKQAQAVEFPVEVSRGIDTTTTKPSAATSSSTGHSPMVKFTCTKVTGPSAPPTTSDAASSHDGVPSPTLSMTPLTPFDTMWSVICLHVSFLYQVGYLSPLSSTLP